MHAGNYDDYLSQIEAEAKRARSEYDLLLVPGLELTYNDLDPFLAAHAVGGRLPRVRERRSGDRRRARAGARRGGGLDRRPSVSQPPGELPRALHAALAHNWRRFMPLVDRWELFNRHDLFGWVAERGLPAVASGDFHVPEHLHGWKTLLPCAKDEGAVVGYLRSNRPAFLTRIDEPAALLDAA